MRRILYAISSFEYGKGWSHAKECRKPLGSEENLSGQQTGWKLGSQSYKNKEMNSANNLMNIAVGLSIEPSKKNLAHMILLTLENPKLRSQPSLHS